MTNVKDQDLILDIDGQVATITLNRPHRRNALTFEMYEEIRQICMLAGKSGDLKDIKALIFMGGGDKAFAAGTDISRFKDFTSTQDAIDYETRVDSVMEEIETCAVPTIAALNGFVTGGGAAIAGACTVRIGAEDIKVGVPIARTLGNCLAISNLRRFIALVGEPRVTYMLVTANLIDAAEAHSAGFISELLPDRDAVIARARALGEEIATFAPLSIRASREGIRRLRVASPLPDDSDLIKLCYESADFKEGMTAFFEKRQPDWRGE